MLREVKVPKFSSTISEATLARWIKKEGEFVKKGEPLFEISALKLNMEVESPFEGVLSKIIVSEGTSIKADDLVAWIDVVEKDESSAASAYVVSGEVATYDVAVIGGGPGGYVAAIRAAQLGARVVLVEKALLGGTCLNWGCIPTKALVKSASVYENIKRASEFGFEVREALIDFKKIMNRKDKIVAALRSGIEQLLRARKIEVVKGQGRISSADEITVYGEKETRKIKVEKGIIIATGSRPAVLPIPGIENTGVLNSDQILELDELPRSITIIGGGVIGMEYAFIFNAFGVDVTVIELMPEILPNMDMEISAALRNAALKRGIKVHASTRVSEIKRAENGG
ncbi:Dihydrolipoyl dehydrogenase [Fervidicola ferrireducens]|uniref:Dihydrolipoyl dehydrogenase n=1 Tax=Fervidicola ferrireducens TaxID=520764 RepID=A0A140L9W5_9FIRM|nr:FAD-dependent oxidoreductase [Fervidicola ferrireducens]KXG77340.1 Dihydrolipoyl dehydrogenase [Fervidicola ferrireducens]